MEILLFEFLAGLVRFVEVSAGENNVVAGLRGNGFGGCVSDTRIGSWWGRFGSVRILCGMWIGGFDIDRGHLNITGDEHNSGVRHGSRMAES